MNQRRFVFTLDETRILLAFKAAYTTSEELLRRIADNKDDDGMFFYFTGDERGRLQP